MKCPICNDKELSGKQKYCSGACKQKALRLKDKRLILEVVEPKVVAPKVVAPVAPVAPATAEESHAQWLKRRMSETGSSTTTILRVGVSAQRGLEAPSKWEDQDLDYVIRAFGGNPKEEKKLEGTYPKTDADKFWWKKNKHMGAEWPHGPRWSPETFKRDCVNCHKPFTTNLERLRTCC
jgi:hypothetical protein